MYPFKFNPVYQERIWGGTNLSTHLDKTLPPGKKIGESWEISSHPNGLSTVANGEFKGKTIAELLEILGEKLLGSSFSRNSGKFPLLVKLLDAQDKLSVQVHPNDDYAAKYEKGQYGKTEMWYVLHAEPGAQIVYGFKEGIKKADVLSAVNGGYLEEVLNYVPAQKGQVFYIPAGLVHALGAGLLVAEIQQDSDLTYRIYDYNRLDNSGHFRQLHVEKALDVIDFDSQLAMKTRQSEVVILQGAKKTLLCSCPEFNVEKISVFKEYVQSVDGSKFYIIMVTAGNGNIIYRNGRENLSFGDSFLVPAGLGDFTINGQCEILLTYIP